MELGTESETCNSDAGVFKSEVQVDFTLLLFSALNEEQKNKALDIAKKRIVEDYYVVGILEQFEDTLRLLELLLPRYFRGALGVWRGGCE